MDDFTQAPSEHDSAERVSLRTMVLIALAPWLVIAGAVAWLVLT